MNEPDHASDVRRRRLLYRATHRGTHETDLLVGGFVAANLPTLTEDEIGVLEAIVELPDPDLAAWLTGMRPIPKEYDSPMMRRLRDAAGA